MLTQLKFLKMLSLLLPLTLLTFQSCAADSNEINATISEGYSATNYTYQYPELEGWQPPLDFLKNYPFYLTGFDDENRPIWVAEWGKFDLRRIVKGGQASMDLFDKYCQKTVRVISKSHDLRSTKELPVLHANFLIDFDGLRLDQITDPQTFAYVLHLAVEHRDIITLHAHRVIVINSNFIAETIIRFARTVFGGLFERVEIFGSNKAQWIPQLLRIFPAEALPEWYGGSKGHKPVIIYG